MKFEIKREVVKRKTISNWGRVFQTALKSGEEGWEFWLFNAFLMLHIRFGNHRLIKINMIYVYIKPEVKKNDATAVIAALCCVITWKLQFGEVDFLVWKMSIFFVSEQNFSPIYRVSSKTIVLGKGEGQSIECVGNKQDERRRNIFGKMGDTGALIQGNKSAGHCFEVMDLIPMNFFK